MTAGRGARRRRRRHIKNVSGRSGLCGTGYVDQRGAVSGAEGKFSFSVMVQELLADGIGVTSMEKIGQWLCDALLYEIKTGKTILLEVVLLAAGFSMIKNFSGTFEKNYVSDICFLLVYGVLCVCC